ncbi:MAG TPA: VOC family protein [Bryobacteraceae bacterium]|jgi:predicted enzyme related to lactoylglutathione lyase|nr:VOC family protein [Bryobacteraceae bacterium]
MATIERHKPGSFCWVELGTTDQSAAKNFYRSLFGWEAKDYPMGPNETYTIFNLGGRDTGGGYTLRPDMLAEGIPPHWMLYVQVENADATVAKAASAGAKPMPPGAFDVAENGRMAVIQDPTGAMFSIWQPKSHTGIHAAGEPGTLCWADLVTGDVDRAKQFYEGLFGWQMKPGEHDPSGYLHIQNGGDFIGGVPPARFRDPKVPPHWLLYFLVESCDAATAKARELGARVYVEPMTMENVGRWSIVADPQGAVFSLFEAMRHE